MPQAAMMVFAASLILCFLGGLSRAVGIIGVASFAVVFAMQGYAHLHAMSRGFQWRNALLMPLYFASFFLFPAPVVLVALFGIAHAFGAGARKGSIHSRQSQSQSLKIEGDPKWKSFCSKGSPSSARWARRCA